VNTLAGVRGISNDIRVIAAIRATAVKQTIEAALRHEVTVDSTAIDIPMDDSTMTPPKLLKVEPHVITD
jgi:hypothetical protein